MATTDDTFDRIVLRAAKPWGATGGIAYTYFRFPEHGGLVDDPLQADFISSIDARLLAWEELSRHLWPKMTWERARLCVEVLPFANPQALDAVIKEQLVKQALAKLTEQEKQALGLAGPIGGVF